MDEFNSESDKEGEDLKIDLLTAFAKASSVEVVRFIRSHVEKYP